MVRTAYVPLWGQQIQYRSKDRLHVGRIANRFGKRFSTNRFDRTVFSNRFQKPLVKSAWKGGSQQQPAARCIAKITKQRLPFILLLAPS